MIRKFFIYIWSGGLIEVLKYISIHIRKKIYYKSETIFLFLDIDELSLMPKQKCDIEYKIIQNKSDLDKIDFNRIKILQYKKWFEKSSQAILGLNNSNPVSFSWSHFQQHSLHGVCKINLSSNKCWIGPTFVDKSMRGKGINKAQIYFQINNAPAGIKYFLTSANASNKASIKSFEKLGFKIGLKFDKNYGIFSNKRTSLQYYNSGKSIINFYERTNIDN
jgi:RimJ/RimL family protein N-acetyltransferase